MSDEATYPISSADDRTAGVHVFAGSEPDQFYWHTVAANGQITAAGAESFTTAEHAWEGFRATQTICVGALLDDVLGLEQGERSATEILSELTEQAAGEKAATDAAALHYGAALERDQVRLQHADRRQELLDVLTTRLATKLSPVAGDDVPDA